MQRHNRNDSSRLADQKAKEEMEPSAIGLSVGLEVLKRTAPRGLSWLITYTKGIELLILGPGGAGKTSIADYLEFGVLEEAQPHEKTQEIQKSRSFQIFSGRDAAIKLRVRRAVDVPGQTGPVEHANLVRERTPHVVLIVLDSTDTQAKLKEWISQFCERFEHHFEEDGKIEKSLKGVFVAMNKRDLVTKSQIFEGRLKEVKRLFFSGLSDALGKTAARSIPTLPVTAVKSSYETTLIDALIRRIAKQVSK